ncbi:alpha/beta hydrolase family protein [Luteimonas kalidii]|uniref:S9 family peptidase n=1 Tax=Luteimonas kalidii TaxID=3042025 RepID=A0ABT6JWP0_9GAMM|nr:S9 family peptidase [Luteimonas kalidii]MDH5835118.1 S9 family peptidase [Luteimonas kalidii]
MNAVRRAPGRWLAVAVLVSVAAWLPAYAQIDLTPYVRHDSYETIKISPDGRHFAATVPMEDRTVLVVLDREDGLKVVAGGMGVRNSAVWDFWWVDDTRIVISMAQSFGSKDPLYATGELHALEIGGSRVKRLFGRKEETGLVTRYGAGDPVELATVIDPMPGSPGEVLIATWIPGTAPKTQLEMLNLRSGRRNVVVAAPVRRADFTLDPAGNARFADGLDERNYRHLYYREGEDAPWRLVNDQAESGFIAGALGMAADGTTAYVQVSRTEGPDEIEAWDMRTMARRPLLRDPVVDPDAILYDVDRRTPVGARYMDDGVTLRFFDEGAPMARRYRMLEKALPGSGIAITSTTRDGRLSLVRAWHDRDAGQYLLFDTEARTANGLFGRMAWFAPESLAPTRKITLEARDGVGLHGYLTRPATTGDAPLPMVVVPHGGPFGIYDSGDFDVETQLLAAAGYAVLRVNFRGSGNYGYAFSVLGAQQWGGTMQDDLTDATRWAIEQGVADPSRICIAGASYGGYAALMGVAKEPELYRCAVGYVGVYDLPAMYTESARSANWMRNWANDWLGERDTLAARSPVNLADRIQAPVLLAAGGADDIAPISHSRRMQRALEKAGVPVRTLYIDSEGHGFRKPEHRRRYYSELLAFLSDHLGGARGE